VTRHSEEQGVGWIHFGGTFYLIAAAFVMILCGRSISGLTAFREYFE
jgi:hypothetical protein